MSAGRSHRRGLARSIAAVAAAFWGLAFFGVIDFLTPFTLGGEWADHYLIETGWGLLYLVMVTVPFLVLIARPGSLLALLELSVVAASLMTGAALAASPAHALPGLAIAVLVAVLAVLSPARRPTWGLPAPLTAVVAVVGVAPASAYVWRMARATDNPEMTWGLDHYPAQAALGLAVVGVALIAACAHAASRRDRWLPIGTAAFSALWLGWQSILWSGRVGSLGSAGGAAAIVWGVALLAAAGADARRRGSGPRGH